MLYMVKSRIFLFLFMIVMFIPFYIVLSRLQGIIGGKLINSKELFHRSEVQQSRRKAHVAEICNFLKINKTLADVPQAYLDHFIVDDTHKLIYCYVPKVACTNWKRILISLRDSESKDPLTISGNETHQPNIFKTLNQFSTHEMNNILQSYSKFLFVRHPYERILSAYRNKLEESYVDYFRVRFGTEIIKAFRKHPTKDSLSKGHDVQFSEFIQYIANLNTTDWKKSFNEHWRPVFDLCFPCHLKFDFIGKYETLEDDATYILQKTALSQYIEFPKRQLSYKKQRTIDVMHTYYRNISKELHKKLFEIYKEDFALFEYETFY